MTFVRIGVTFLVPALLAGCTTSESDPRGGEPEIGEPAVAEISQADRSGIPGCYFFVDSYYEGNSLSMARGRTIDNLKRHGMNDKISAVYFIGGATARMWIHTGYRGRDWLITEDVPTFHTSAWDDLGDNSSSIDCY